MINRFFPWFLVFFIIAINVANFIAICKHTYFYIAWLDIPMHFLSGVWIGLMILWWYFFSGRFVAIPKNRRTAGFSLGLVFAATMLIVILWEVFEYVVHILLGRPDFNNFFNSASDIFFGMLGAMLSAGFFVIKKYYVVEKK